MDLLDFPGYRVEEDGRVYSYKRNRYLRPSYHADGYAQFMLRNKNGKYKTARAHRLVATAYLQNPDNLPQVNHKDSNTRNNHYTNLEWCTQLDNLKHQFGQSKYAGLIRPSTDELIQSGIDPDFAAYAKSKPRSKK